MKIDINITPEFIVDAIEDYCSSHVCPTDCVFDKIGVCTEQNPFNDYSDKYQEYMKKEN